MTDCPRCSKWHAGSVLDSPWTGSREDSAEPGADWSCDWTSKQWDLADFMPQQTNCWSDGSLDRDPVSGIAGADVFAGRYALRIVVGVM